MQSLGAIVAFATKTHPQRPVNCDMVNVEIQQSSYMVRVIDYVMFVTWIKQRSHISVNKLKSDYKKYTLK